MVLQLLVGMSMSPVAKYLQFVRRILVKILKTNNLAKITIPCPEKLEEYRATIASHHPSLDMVWSTMDRLKCCIENHKMKSFNQDFVMAGNQNVLCLLYYVLVQMVSLPLHSTISHDVAAICINYLYIHNNPILIITY